jgi:hypothetical protein
MCISTLRKNRAAEISLGSSLVTDDVKNAPHSASSTTVPRNASKRTKHPHIIVQHNYHDHAHDAAPLIQEVPAEDCAARGGVGTPFPLKLHEMLQNVVQDGYAHIVSWQPHGRCFVVHKPELFKQLLPKYFKLSKIASFQRQLNLYGFQRLTRGLDKGGYYHELFLRHRVFLAPRIQRVKVKGTGVRARSNPNQEPEFWDMPWVAEESTTEAPAPVSSESSVVSQESGHERSHAEYNYPQKEMVQSSIYAPSAPSPVSSYEETMSSMEADLILSGWGKPFHYLGHPMDAATSNTKTISDLPMPETDFEFDELLTEIFEEDDDCAFADLLERIIA